MVINMLDYRSDIYSTTGNDGIIELVFDILDVDQGFFVEFGAWDGIVGSNCKKLIDEGWKGIFIEADPKKFQALKKNYANQEGITCLNKMVDTDKNLFDVLVDPYAKEIDFCSIDIDGLDLEIFETFHKHFPKVVCIEGGQMLHPMHPRISAKKAKNNIQQSLYVMNEAFSAKGYSLICSYQDSFFVRSEYKDMFDVSDNIMSLYLDGLEALPRRMPWIQKTLRSNGLSNKIINRIMNNCNFAQYGYKRRKEWAVSEYGKICSYIKELRKELA